MMPFNTIWGPQRQGIFHQIFAIIGTCCISYIVWELWHAGHVGQSGFITSAMLLIFWVGNLSFTVKFFAHQNENLEVDRFVFPHMLWGQFGLLVLGYYAPAMLEVSMMFSLAAFVFVAFGLSSGRLFIAVIVISFGFVLIYHFHPAIRPKSDQTIILSAYVIAATFIAVVNAYFGNFQIHLSKQNSIIQKRTAELELAQRQLLNAKNIAEDAADSKTRFLAAASHDLRQPLHALDMYLGALSNQESVSVRQHILSQMEKSASELGELLSTLFDISRFDSNVVDVSTKVFGINEVIDGLSLEFSELSELMARPLKIRPSIAVVESDPILIQRIIRGLVANGLRHAEKGRVLVGFRSRAEYIRCEVWDSGQGILESEHDKVFEEFCQLKNSNRDRQKGLGLGLALIKRMCTALDLPLGMKSEVGRGSVFWFEIKKATQVCGTKLPSLESIHPRSLIGRTVMCIDDEQSVLEGMSLLLKSWGCVAVSAVSSNQALNMMKFSNKKPDLIICDYRLANEQNGIDVISQLQRNLNEQVPAILVTGDIDPDIGIRANKHGIKLLKKPLSASVFYENVSQAFMV